MNSYLLSPRAQLDISEIWDYTAVQWDTDQAERYVRQIQTAIQTLAHKPLIGQPCDEIRAGYRKYPAGSHMIFFRLVSSGIEVVRILHKRMDIARRL